MGIRTLIFDWDGTLHDTKALYGASLRGTLRWLISQGYPVPENQSDEYLSRYLGVNARDMWMDYMPELPLEVREECSRRTGEQMVKEINAGNAKLYPGTLPVLSALKDSGYRLVILSNCKVPYMNAQRKAFGLDAWIESYFCSGAYDFRPK
ncbi:MAG: HAD hydrolase-like protein, partial [Eubacteriales bacterium]|nr:HAD hydrolase-like protein [Eubacteriales bacterium]